MVIGSIQYMENSKDKRTLSRQIADKILHGIETGKYKEGEKLPSERELAECFGVCRITIRQAIEYLVSDDVLFRKQRRGTFVAGRKIINSLGQLQGVTEELSTQHVSMQVEVVEHEIVPAIKEIRRKLGIREGATVLKITRLISTENQPLGIDYSYLPVTIAYLLDGFDPRQDAIYKLLELYGYKISWANQTIRAGIPAFKEADMLQIEMSTPVLKLARTTYLEGNVPVIYSETVYCADRYQYDVVLERKTILADKNLTSNSI